MRCLQGTVAGMGGGLYPEILGKRGRAWAIPADDMNAGLGAGQGHVGPPCQRRPTPSVSTDDKCDPNLWRFFGACLEHCMMRPRIG